MAAVAEALNASSSSISQQLGLLEDETGVCLFEPVGRGVRLTPAARALVEHTRVIVERLERAEAELQTSGDTLKGTLRVASFESLISTLVPPAILHLAQEHADLRVEIVHQDPRPALDGLLTHEFDLVMGEELPGLPQRRRAELHEEDLVYDEILLALPKAGPWAGRARRLPSLGQTPWVMDPPDNSFADWSITRCREAGFEPDIRYETADPELQLRFVETGLAAAFVPRLFVRNHNARVRLVRLKGRPARRLFTISRRSSAAHPAVVAFRTSMQIALGQTT